MIPWTCDALLSVEERHASSKFRRFRNYFNAEWIQYEDAVELVAFLHAVPIRCAKFIFGWNRMACNQAERLLKHLSDDDAVAGMVEANALAMSRADGLACLKAMQEGGWTNGGLPPMVRLALLDMLDAGMSRPAIGAAVGLTIDQVRVCMGRSPVGVGRAKASALLAL